MDNPWHFYWKREDKKVSLSDKSDETSPHSVKSAGSADPGLKEIC